ncbi:hypothetical protein CYMTET_28800 [Cymbomonas tetramitiformis]|uniref:Uncharacterized protein n=1 Tax=Cymbomonas tetramitiformis TaxID=36881 RepID=A0AAE0KVT6_9CHLO|nr:hypothetical protein CYMTET_28800 [Cymbomonas tetramitiformis]
MASLAESRGNEAAYAAAEANTPAADDGEKDGKGSPVLDQPSEDFAERSVVYQCSSRPSLDDVDPSLFEAESSVWEALATLEKLQWVCCERVPAAIAHAMLGSLHSQRLDLEALRWLMPSHLKGGQADNYWPALRRVQKLSYVLAAQLPEISRDGGRQSLLEVKTILKRMEIILSALQARQARLSAVISIDQADDEGNRDDLE